MRLAQSIDCYYPASVLIYGYSDVVFCIGNVDVFADRFKTFLRGVLENAGKQFFYFGICVVGFEFLIYSRIDKNGVAEATEDLGFEEGHGGFYK